LNREKANIIGKPQKFKKIQFSTLPFEAIDFILSTKTGKWIESFPE